MIVNVHLCDGLDCKNTTCSDNEFTVVDLTSVGIDKFELCSDCLLKLKKNILGGIKKHPDNATVSIESVNTTSEKKKDSNQRTKKATTCKTGRQAGKVDNAIKDYGVENLKKELTSGKSYNKLAKEIGIHPNSLINYCKANNITKNDVSNSSKN